MMQHGWRGVAAAVVAACGAVAHGGEQGGKGGGAADAPVSGQAFVDEREARTFKNLVRLTSPREYFKAGEAYFDADGHWVVFQAVEAEAGVDPAVLKARPYAMYVASVGRGADGRIKGLDPAIRISAPGSANTCGYFHPTQPAIVIFGSTLGPFARAEGDGAGFSRDKQKYVWDFPEQMRVARRRIKEVMDYYLPKIGRSPDDGVNPPAVALFEQPGYSAECAFSPTGRFIVYTNVNPETRDGDIWVYDTLKETRVPLVTAKGYDGGPFFSPDGKKICYRSDRKGDGNLQIFVADLAQEPSTFGEEGEETLGAITGIERERAVTDNGHVNWAPYWHPSGDFLVYATSEVGHDNYEVFSVEAPVGDRADAKPEDLKRRRLTFAAGFDGLPSFSKDGKWMLWTSQRPAGPGGLPAAADPALGRIESQVWAAEVIDAAP